MTYARSILIPRGSPGTFHCVSRCVRRAFLCGEDRLTGRSFEHRRQWVEDRIHELADIFGVAIWGYAVMSNHVHVVVQILPEVVSRWSNDEIVERWMRLYPRQDQNPEMRAEVLAGNAERIEVLRERLSNLSWFRHRTVDFCVEFSGAKPTKTESRKTAMRAAEIPIAARCKPAKMKG